MDGLKVLVKKMKIDLCQDACFCKFSHLVKCHVPRCVETDDVLGEDGKRNVGLRIARPAN